MNENVNNALILINHDGFYFTLFLIALFIMLLGKKKEARIFSVLCIIGLLSLICPFSSDLVNKLIYSDGKYYLNFFLIPMIFAISYAIIYVIKVQKGMTRKLGLSACIMLLIIISGKIPYTNDLYMTNAESEMLSTETNQIFNVILQQNEKEKAIIAPNEVLKLAEIEYPGLIRLPYSVEIMQNAVEKENVYDTVIIDLYDMVNYGEGGIGKVVMRAREYGYPFIVFSNSFETEWPMTNGGYKKMLETEHYILYMDSSM